MKSSIQLALLASVFGLSAATAHAADERLATPPLNADTSVSGSASGSADGSAAGGSATASPALDANVSASGSTATTSESTTSSTKIESSSDKK